MSTLTGPAVHAELFQDCRPFEYAQVDVFTEDALAGNMLAVFTDARGLSTEQMQALARETNLAETSFILPRDAAIEQERGVQVRIFTTQEELQFAGHPTLGTASWLYWNHPVLRGSEVITLDLPVGPIPVRFGPQMPNKRGVFGTMQQRDPVFGAVHDRAAVAAALGLSVDDLDPELPIQTVSTGMAFCIVPLRSMEVAARLCIPQNTAQAYLDQQRREVLPLHHPRRGRVGRGLARAHAVLQRRGSGDGFGLRLRHRLPGAARAGGQRAAHPARAGHRDPASQPHLCAGDAGGFWPGTGAEGHKSVRRRPHHSCSNGTLFPAVIHLFPTAVFGQSPTSIGHLHRAVDKQVEKLPLFAFSS